VVGSEKHVVYNVIEACIMAVHGLGRSLIWVLIESDYATSYSRNFGPIFILHYFGDAAA